MDHKEEHHLHHRKEREREKKEKKAYEHAQEKKLIPFHRLWVFVVGIVLLILALLVWTLFLSW